MNQDLYNVYMVLCNGLDCWWQGYATDGGHALDLAWEYATKEPAYQSEPSSWEIELA